MGDGFQVVIIGAGAGGLTAGLFLARAGLHVTICEQRSRVGGLLTATGTGPHLLDVRLPCLCSQGVVFPILAELGLDPQRLFIRAHWQVVTPGIILPLNSFDIMYAKLQAYFPQQIQALSEYFLIMQEAIVWLKKILLPHPYLHSKSILQPALAALLRPWSTFKMGKLLHISTQQFLLRQFTDPELVRLLMNLGYPNMPALLHAGMWYLFLEDYWQPRGGLYGFTTLLAEHFEQAGGKLVTNAKVKTIMVEGGRASGIELANGDKVLADAVISGVDYNFTYTSLIPQSQVPAVFLQSLFKRQPSEAYVTVCLSTGIPMAVLNRLGAVHTCYFPEDDLPTGMIISAPDATKASETVEQAPRVYLSHRGTYRGSPAEHRARLIRAATNLLPGLEQQILSEQVWYPKRYEWEFGGFGGASAGWNLDPLHMLRLGFPGWKSPIQNLYHASQWTYSPGGVPAAMLSARQAGRHIMRTARL